MMNHRNVRERWHQMGTQPHHMCLGALFSLSGTPDAGGGWGDGAIGAWGGAPGRCHRSVRWGPGNNAGEEEELSAGRGRGKERGGENSREGGRHHQRVGPVTSPGLARCGKEGLQLEWAHGPLWAARFSRWGLLFCGLDEGTGSENHTFTQPPN